jgi:hypothetical protein
MVTVNIQKEILKKQLIKRFLILHFTRLYGLIYEF